MVLNEHTPVPTQITGTGSLDFTTFMRSYQDMVFSTAARLSGNDAQAQDIAQEVFVRAYEHFAELSGSASAGGWLKTVATNLSINYLNRYRKRWRMFSEMRAAADDESAPEIEWETPDTLLSDLSAEQRRLIVDAALKQLPAHQRMPLVLYHFEDMPYQDIAAKLGISLTKVKTDIRRARAALLPALKQAAAQDTLEN
jgi:RNA polymerase sigma-70 factor, ECF subfamily